MLQTVYSNVNILLNMAESLKSCLTELCSLISIKLFVSESPHFTGWRDLIFSEIPHCMELNSSQIPRVYGVGGGGHGWERLELTGT